MGPSPPVASGTLLLGWACSVAWCNGEPNQPGLICLADLDCCLTRPAQSAARRSQQQSCCGQMSQLLVMHKAVPPVLSAFLCRCQGTNWPCAGMKE